MRVRTQGYYYVLLIPIVIGLFVFVSRVTTFVQLFFQHAGQIITQDEVAAAHAAQHAKPRPQHIPKILHHIYHNWHNRSMPEDWVANRKACMDLNPDWDFMLWTEENSREFLNTHFPWFISTYDNYPHPVQRVDTIKYFLMLHYGGIYLDMDNTCLTDLTPLLYYSTWITDGGCGALSNNVLASRPNHPFWQLLTSKLIPYSYNYLFPYITISYASGQWFETLMWDAYHYKTNAQALMLDDSDKDASASTLTPYRLRMDERPGMDHWIYFGQGRGGSWNSWDNVMFLWIGDHLILLALLICSLVAAVVWSGSRLIAFLRRRRRHHHQDHRRRLLKRHSESGKPSYSPEDQGSDLD